MHKYLNVIMLLQLLYIPTAQQMLPHCASFQIIGTLTTLYIQPLQLFIDPILWWIMYKIPSTFTISNFLIGEKLFKQTNL